MNQSPVLLLRNGLITTKYNVMVPFHFKIAFQQQTSMKPLFISFPTILHKNLNTLNSTHLHAMTKPNLAPIPNTLPLEVLAKI